MVDNRVGFIHRYHQYFNDFGDRKKDSLNFLNQIEGNEGETRQTKDESSSDLMVLTAIEDRVNQIQRHSFLLMNFINLIYRSIVRNNEVDLSMCGNVRESNRRTRSVVNKVEEPLRC